MRRLLGGLPLVLLAALLCGCTGQSAPPSPGLAQGTIDTLHGTYRGVYLGMALRGRNHTTVRGTVVYQLGEPLPTNDDTYLDPAQAPPFLPADNPYDWVYPDVSITIVKGFVASMTIYGRGAVTTSGIGIGDRLSSVVSVYPRARCSPGRKGAQPEDPGCQIHPAAGHWVYFGGDPIRVIAISRAVVLP
jgi:hypothetical protein